MCMYPLGVGKLLIFLARLSAKDHRQGMNTYCSVGATRGCVLTDAPIETIGGGLNLRFAVKDITGRVSTGKSNVAL